MRCVNTGMTAGQNKTRRATGRVGFCNGHVKHQSQIPKHGRLPGRGGDVACDRVGWSRPFRDEDRGGDGRIKRLIILCRFCQPYLPSADRDGRFGNAGGVKTPMRNKSG